MPAKVYGYNSYLLGYNMFMTTIRHAFSMYNDLRVNFLAPVSDATIDSNVHYNEGDKMTFNCSSKGDPNHSMVYTELIKDSIVLETITGPDFSSGYNDTYDNNCLVDLQWSGGSPNPLTTDQNDVIVRCVVKNTLLNESKTSEKRLNVSVVGRYFDHIISNFHNLCTRIV